MLVGTPTFLGNIFGRAKPGDLDSLRLILVARSSVPKRCSSAVQRLPRMPRSWKGYGITECSPIVRGQPAGCDAPGHGRKTVARVELLVLDLDTENRSGRTSSARCS